MKKILCGAVAAIALVGAAAPAAAQTNQVHYNALGIELTNPTGFLGGLAQGTAELGLINGIGTRYTASSTSRDDSAPAKDRIDVTFKLSGRVNEDCSFYAGNNSNAQNIDFGVIGVRTGDNENVGSAFNMVGTAVANVRTLTAGCNTNNAVEISKNDIRGLVNNNPGGYNSDEFQANIPYSVTAAWTGAAATGPGAPTNETLTVGTTSNAGLRNQGAWRSDMRITFTAPVAAKALVAGNYVGETKVTLRAN